MTPELRILIHNIAKETTDLAEAITVAANTLRGDEEFNDIIFLAGLEKMLSVERGALRTPTVDSQTAFMRGLASFRLRTGYAFRLPTTGKRLGKATVSDLQDCIDFHRDRATGDLRRADMFRRIMFELALNGNRGTTVEQAIAEPRLRKLMENAD